MRKITLSDIAQKTGFSVNTVSHALKDKSDISKETKKYINDTAIAMGYIPNISAGVLRGGKTMSVAIIIDNSASPYYAEAIKEAERFLHKKGYSLLLTNTYGDEELERSAIIRALSQNVDGIILSPVQKSDANIDFLKENGTPYILFGRKDKKSAYVAPDYAECGYQAAKHLTDLGHSKILFINTPSYADESLSGIKKAFKEASLSLDGLFVKTLGASDDIEEIISERPDFSAVICVDDTIAAKVYRRLSITQKNVPEEISLISFGSISDYAVIPITSVGVTPSQLALEAAASLLDMINKNEPLPQTVLPIKLFLGETTKEVSSRFRAQSRRVLSDYLL